MATKVISTLRWSDEFLAPHETVRVQYVQQEAGDFSDSNACIVQYYMYCTYVVLRTLCSEEVATELSSVAVFVLSG